MTLVLVEGAMGAWDVDAFGNDTACDWAYGLESAPNLSYISETLQSVAQVGDEYLDSDAACEALAACEVIARLKGNWGVRNSYTETADSWVQAHSLPIPEDLVASALAAIDRITSAPSELLELWTEADPSDWLASVKDLRARVVADGGEVDQRMEPTDG